MGLITRATSLGRIDEQDFWNLLYDEQEPEKNDSIWTTKDGREIPIRNMETSHIKNTMKYLIKEYGEHAMSWKVYKNLDKESLRRDKGYEPGWDE